MFDESNLSEFTPEGLPEDNSELESNQLQETPEKKRGRPFLSSEEMQARRDHLLSIGFNQGELTRAEKYHPQLFNRERVEQAVRFLTNYRFLEPVSGKEHRFQDPLRAVKKNPTFLASSIESIDAKISGLRERGFTNPEKMIEAFPATIGYAFENIDTKILGLRERGFRNPEKMIETSPTLLGLTFENIDAKIQGLKDRGFSDPEKMIETLPVILGLAFKNIDRRLNLFGRIIHLYQLPLSPTGAMEKATTLWTAKPDKLIVLARVIRGYNVNSEEADGVMSTLSTINLEDLLIALQSKKSGESTTALTKRAREVKKQHLSREEKRELIAQDLESVRLDRRKISQRYFKGYPEKK